MKVIPIFCYNTLRNFSYLVTGKSFSACIDPFDADLILKIITGNKMNLDFILNTHGHHDHIKGNEEIRLKTGAKIVSIKENEKLSLSKNESLVALDTPGHTMDHQCFLGQENGETKFIMSGDTLFNAGVGNCKNGGDKKTLYQTVLKMIKLFPNESIIYPGHDYFQNNLEFAKSINRLNIQQNKYYEQNIKAEKGNFPFLPFKEVKKINEFLKAPSLSEFLNLRDQRDEW